MTDLICGEVAVAVSTEQHMCTIDKRNPISGLSGSRVDEGCYHEEESHGGKQCGLNPCFVKILERFQLLFAPATTATTRSRSSRSTAKHKRGALTFGHLCGHVWHGAICGR